jgi:6-phospho-3-hexuloisomerase
MTHRKILQLSNDILGEVQASLKDVDPDSLDALVDELEKARKVFCLGAGRSGILLQAFCMRLNHLGFEAYMAGGLPCPPVGDGDLIVVASGSGKTRSVTAVLDQGRSAGARVAIFTARRPTTRAMSTEVTILIPAPSSLINAGSTRSQQPMRTLFEQVFFLLCESVICCLKAKKGIGEAEMAERHANLE